MDPLPWFAPPPTADTSNVVIVGAGLAGCHLAAALSKSGVAVTLIEAGAALASEASANTRCVLRPHVVRSDGLHNRFNEHAFTHARKTLATLEREGQRVERGFPGVLQFLRHQGNWPTLQTATAVDTAQASALAGIPLSSPALYFARAGWVNAASYCRALIASITASPHFKLLLDTRVRRMVPAGASHQHRSAWRLDCRTRDSAAPRVLHASTVVLCCGAGSRHIPQLTHLPLQLSSGQTTSGHWPAATPQPMTVLCGRRYLIPTDAGITLGATHWRDNAQSCLDPHDDALNVSALQELVPDLTSRSGGTLASALVVNAHWRSLRASTPDRLPLVGAVPDEVFYRDAYARLQHGPRHQEWPAARYVNGLYTLAGLGSRGAATASLCADILARQITSGTANQPGGENQHYAQLLHPARFLVRQLKRTPVVAADGILGTDKPGQ